MKRINSFYLFIILLFVGLLTVNSYFFKGSKSFLGITSSREYKVNVERSALIENVHVVSGQTVKPGDLLVELSSKELELEIAKLKKEIEQAESKMEERTELLNSKLALFEAERRQILSARNNELKAIDNSINLNKSLISRYTGEMISDSLSDLETQKQSIIEESELKIEELNIRILDTRQEYNFDMESERSVIELTQQELEWKQEESRQLNRYATFPGVIENVYVKPGEQVEAFSSIVSINPEHPTSAVGYLVGKKDRDKQLGEQVTIQSLEHKELSAEGRIIGFGSVVDLPEILQKSTAVKAFGLEVFIEIPEENALPVGEKIIIK